MQGSAKIKMLLPWPLSHRHAKVQRAFYLGMVQVVPGLQQACGDGAVGAETPLANGQARQDRASEVANGVCVSQVACSSGHAHNLSRSCTT